MSLKEMIENDNKAMADAKQEYLIHLKKYQDIKYPIESKHCAILKNFLGRLNRKIEDKHDCGSCSPRYWDTADFCEVGICVFMDADHPNDRRDKDYTWEEVKKILCEPGVECED